MARLLSLFSFGGFFLITLAALYTYTEGLTETNFTKKYGWLNG